MGKKVEKGEKCLEMEQRAALWLKTGELGGYGEGK
jgi:hypothetical protein